VCMFMYLCVCAACAVRAGVTMCVCVGRESAREPTVSRKKRDGSLSLSLALFSLFSSHILAAKERSTQAEIMARAHEACAERVCACVQE
jgi:hypothetical protein